MKSTSGSSLPWFCLVAFLGYGRRFLRSGGRVLKYAATASYPVYLLHQTVIVAVGFVVLKAGLGVPWSFTLIVIGSLAGSLLGYEIARRVNVLRFLVGLKPVKRNTGTRRTAAEVQPAGAERELAAAGQMASSIEGARNSA